MDGLRKWWDGLSDGERRAILVVAPIVALALIIAALRGRQRADADTARRQMDTVGQVAGGPTGGYGVEPGTAIGVDQLADYQNATTDQFDQVYGAIDQIAGQVEGIQVGESSPGGDDDPPVQDPVDITRERQQILDLMNRVGVPEDHQHGSGETRTELAERLARDLKFGVRDYSKLKKDLEYVARESPQATG